MGAQRHPRDGGFSEAFDEAARHAAPPNAEELVLPLEPDEMRMLQIFHKSFNLPGLRLGLVRPVAEEDYYPPDEEFEEEPPVPPPQQHQRGPPPATATHRRAVGTGAPHGHTEEPDRASELAALLQRTRAMHLATEQVLAGAETDALTIDDEAIADEPDPPSFAAAHQRQVLRRPGSSGSAHGSKPSSAAGRARGRW